jgi:hypothetical protein
MIVVSTTQKEVVIKRAFKSLVANDVRQKLEVGYIEITELDGEIIKQEEKVYQRDYAFWKNSELGVAILELINADLVQENPATPREI